MFHIRQDAPQLAAGFFTRASLPVQAKDVTDYLTNRLNQDFDQFLEQSLENIYADLDEIGWQLSVDATTKLDAADKQRLNKLQAWPEENLRDIKLPELLIEVDNELHVTNHFIPLA